MRVLRAFTFRLVTTCATAILLLNLPALAAAQVPDHTNVQDNVEGSQQKTSRINEHKDIENLVEDRQYDEALTKINSILSQQPDDTTVLGLAARAYLGKGDSYNALIACQQAIRSGAAPQSVYDARSKACSQLALTYDARLASFRSSGSGFALPSISQKVTFRDNVSLRLMQKLPVCFHPGMKDALAQLRFQMEGQDGVSPDPKHFHARLKILNHRVQRKRTPGTLLARAGFYQKTQHYKEAIADYTDVIAMAVTSSCSAAIAHARRAVCHSALKENDLANDDVKSLLLQNEENDRHKISVVEVGKEDSPEATQLLSAVVKAMGTSSVPETGYREVWIRTPSPDSAGQAERRLVYWSKGEKWRWDYPDPMLHQSAFDGARHWSKFGNWATVYCDPTDEQTTSHDIHKLLKDASEGKLHTQLLEPVRIGNKHCPGIKLISRDPEPAYLWFDPDTHLVLRKQYRKRDPICDYVAVKTANYSDYRSVDGREVPFKRTYDGRTYTVLEINDQPLSDNIFVAPPESSIKLAAAVSVPYESAKDGAISVECKINGQTRRMIVDTGSSTTSIDAKWVKHTAGKQNRSSQKGEKEADYIKLDSLQIGGITLPDFCVVSNEGQTLCEGVIGMDVLGRFLTTIDLKNQTLILADRSTNSSQEHSFALPMSWIGKRPAVVGILNDVQKIPFMLDTGSSPLFIPFPFAQTTYFTGMRSGFSQDMLMHCSDRCYATGGDLKIGNYVIRQPSISFDIPAQPLNGKPYGLMGYSIMCSSFDRITLDSQNNKVIFEPKQTNQTAEHAQANSKS